MTEKFDDGGPAFACASCNGHQEGMTLWDYYAAHAPLPPIDFNIQDPDKFTITLRMRSTAAFGYATLMIAERQKRMKG